MLFKLSVQMKPKTIYCIHYHLDIASHWQIKLLFLQWWLGMAEQKFNNSRCGRLGREAEWRSLRHKPKRQLVCSWTCRSVRKCFIFLLQNRPETQKTELTWVEMLRKQRSVVTPWEGACSTWGPVNCVRHAARNETLWGPVQSKDSEHSTAKSMLQWNKMAFNVLHTTFNR